MLRNPVALAACVRNGSASDRGTEPNAAWCNTMSTESQTRRHVAVDESVTFPCSFADRTAYFVQVPAMAGLEVIDADDILIEPQERFQ